MGVRALQWMTVNIPNGRARSGSRIFMGTALVEVSMTIARLALVGGPEE
jgi:hypothetical protein